MSSECNKIKGPASFKETNPYCAVRLILKTFFTELKQGKNAGTSCRTMQHNKVLSNLSKRGNQQLITHKLWPPVSPDVN